MKVGTITGSPRDNGTRSLFQASRSKQRVPVIEGFHPVQKARRSSAKLADFLSPNNSMYDAISNLASVLNDIFQGVAVVNVAVAALERGQLNYSQRLSFCFLS